MRSGLPVAGNRRVNQPRILSRQRVVCEAEAGHDAGTIVLDYDVRRPRQPFEDGAALAGLQVERDASLAAVDGVEAGAVEAGRPRHLPRRVAGGRLDLDHVGAEIGEQHRAERAGHHLRGVEDAQTIEGAGESGHLVI